MVVTIPKDRAFRHRKLDGVSAPADSVYTMVMSTYIALLRGLAPDGAAATAERLRGILSYIGFQRIRIDADDGAAVFEAKDNNRKKMEAEIGFELRHAAGQGVDAILMTLGELRTAAAHPLADSGDEGKLYVTVLGHETSRENIDLLMETMNGVDEHAVVGTAVFSYYGEGYEASRRSNEFFEKVLKAPATTRTWAAMRRILELASREYGSARLLGGEQ